MSRLKERYQKEVVPALTKEFGYKNVMAVPRIHKVVINMGLGEATSNVKIVDTGSDELARITGQKPVTRRSKKSIAAFKVQEANGKLQLAPAWISRDMNRAEPPIIANGIIFAYGSGEDTDQA